MKFISHRGNIAGNLPERENTRSYIEEALFLGYDVEVDVWAIKGEFYLGHDSPLEQVAREFLQNSRLWVHCKNTEAFTELSKYHKINVFYQDRDLITKTSFGYFWNHSENLTENNKAVLISLKYSSSFEYLYSFGICSDEIEKFRDNHSEFLRPRLPIELLIIDIDGVMTDGTKTYDKDARVFAKNYCDLDFTAIKRFKAAGVKVCFLSGDTTINEKMAESRQVDFFHARLPDGNIDKSKFIKILQDKYNLYSDRMAYVGDDYYDLSIIENLEITFCPSTACSTIKKAVLKVLNTPGGHGVIAEIYSIYEDNLPEAFPVDSLEVNPK